MQRLVEQEDLQFHEEYMNDQISCDTWLDVAS